MGVYWVSDVRVVRPLGGGDGGFARIGVSDVRLLRPGGGGQAHFPAGFSSDGGWVAGLDAGLMGRENEPVPGDDGGWASIGDSDVRFVPSRGRGDGGVGRTGFSDVGLVRPGGGASIGSFL
jgi:hypothetical protein